MPGIGVITNPRSKANRRDPAGMDRLGYLLGTRGEAEATGSLDDLYRVAEQFKAANIDVLGINGGDGTISVTLTAFIEVYGDAPLPRVAILRGGTLNTIAKGLGIRGTPQAILYEVIERYHSGAELRTIERPILRIEPPGGPARYGFIFGNGIVANFLEAYYATGKPSPMTGALVLARGILSGLWGGPYIRRLFRRFQGRVTVDGVAWERGDYATITGATVPEIGLGFAPYARCFESLERFPLLGFTCSPMGLVASLPRVYKGQPVRADRAITVLARELLIETTAAAPYTIDGDLLSQPPGPLRVATGPRIRLIVPEGDVDL
jgi:diacylglycerol kinase family enzyme